MIELAVLLVTSFNTLGTPCRSQAEGQARRSPPLAQQLALKLELDRSAYVVGEPLRMTLSLRNTGTVDLRGLFEDVYPWSPVMRIDYRRSGSAFTPLDRDRVNFHRGYRYIGLKPGQVTSGTGWRAMDRGRTALILDEPGSYEFKATFCGGELGSAVTSKVVTVTVEAAPDGHRDAWRAYSPTIAEFTHWMRSGDQPEQAVEQALDFVERFPESPWSSKVRRGLLVDLPNLLMTNRETGEGPLRERYDTLRATAQRRGELREDGLIIP